MIFSIIEVKKKKLDNVFWQQKNKLSTFITILSSFLKEFDNRPNQFWEQTYPKITSEKKRFAKHTGIN